MLDDLDPIGSRQLRKQQKVYIVHGNNQEAKDALEVVLTSYGLYVIEKEIAAELAKGGAPFLDQILHVAFRHAQAVIILLTGEEKVRLRSKFWDAYDAPYEREFCLQPDPDQIIEAGYAFGLSRDRTILLQYGNTRPFSDIAGRYTLPFSGANSNLSLYTHLEKAGCVMYRPGSS